MSEGDKRMSGRPALPSAGWLVLPGTLAALLLAILCWAALLYLKPEWTTAFIGWWLGGIFLQRFVFSDDDAGLMSLTGTPAFSLVLIAAFLVLAVFFPQFVVIIGGLTIAAAVVFFILSYLRNML